MRSAIGLVAVAATVGAPWVAAPAPAAAQGCLNLPIVGLVGQVAAAGGASVQQACGAVLAFNGPTLGNLSSVVGPTVVGGPVLAPVAASTGGPNVVSALP